MSFKIVNRPPKYPPIHDGNRVCYLLLYLGVPSDRIPPPSKRHLKGVTSAKRAGKSLGVKVWPVRLLRDDAQGNFRYFFRFPWYRRDDKQALRIAESVLYAVSAVHGPSLGTYETSPVFRVPAELTRDEDAIPIDKLVQVEEFRALDDRTMDFPKTMLGMATFISSPAVDAAWEIAPAILRSETLYRAVRFLKASQDDFYVWPSQIDEVLDQPGLWARTGFEQSRMENALQNAFKAVEAVLGDPPKDDRKFFSRIKAAGLDPNEQVGYRTETPLHEVIRDMNLARDKKSAHGSMSDRMISVGGLMEYQQCARYIVLSAIEKQLGEGAS